VRRVLVDTNVLLAALVFPAGTAAQAFLHVVADEQLVLTDWILDEARDVVGRKWPDRLPALGQLLADLEYELLPIGTSGIVIRDLKDQPILDAAIAGAVDTILTGDKDFLALDLDRPRVLQPRAYLDLVS
jgi:putative PIN family toxin of toxin-antitoxin system